MLTALCAGAKDAADAPPARAATLEAQCAAVFSDHAVFQQNIPIPVWGWSLPDAKVSVTFDQQTKSTIAGIDGRWDVALDPMKAVTLDALHEAPAGRTLNIVTELDGNKATKSFTDILIGEVWLCSGQSNMAAKVRHNHANQDPQDNLLKSNLPAIRHISAPGGWQMAVPGSVGEFTRVGFCFARKVQRELKVPIGLVNACKGGSNIESWMRVAPQNFPEADNQKKKVNYAGLYHERLAPLIGYGMHGALWYQGEANASEGHSYFLKMQSLINDWRKSWKLGDFPFYFVQLAGIGNSPADNPAMGDGRARIREAQRQALNIKNTGMAVAVDIGSEREHPANKVEVGIRLAHWALHHDYGRKEICPSGPLYNGFKIEGAAIRISFDHAQGLMLATKEDYAAPVPTPDEKIPWLSIQAKDGSWHWAEGKIDGVDLVVSSNSVKQPVAIRYAYTQRPLGPYLYNKHGLPASPFSTSGDSVKQEPDAGEWAFVSIPDFLNFDIEYPQEGWENALGFILESMKGENPAFAMVAGDLVMGHWGSTKDDVAKWADIYYPQWIKRFADHDLKVYTALGDHEVGDNPWRGDKAKLVPHYKAAFRHHLKMPLNGPEHMQGTAFHWVHKNVLFVSVDVFEQGKSSQGEIAAGVTGEQLKWFEAVVRKHRALVDHIVVMGHTPILRPVRTFSSSGMLTIEGRESAFWQTMVKYDVDLYLCG
ncbi:MAG: sialate O-acetylesterase, partial [Verrucomicrobiales bacterium]